ncbi:hypothetical protein J2S74_002404 [Evansella vedderi]|uniref:DUF2953 domain-containing protein n=1 Tax=Evansella vedderi TaxID=38282 RepID=A0ABT9ZUV6_9BACI|nr:DUF2953 domain-containing protein [Evansella vedderi]MDQ0255022.1 hypothetical protein [Evansella vedderi]
MKYILVGILLLCMLLPLLFFIKMKVLINYSHNGQDDELSLQFRTLGFIKYSVNLPLLAIDDETPSVVYEEKRQSALGEKDIKEKFTLHRFLDDLKHFHRFLKHVVGFHTILRKFMQKMSIDKFLWESEIGTGDAALTGSASGLLWGIKGNTLGVISNYMNWKTKPQISVVPQFQQMLLKTSFECMVSFRIGHAILAGLKVLRHWKKGRTLFKSTDTAGRDINV